MAFGFNSQPPQGGSTQGPDLEVIQTESLGFLALAGDAKVRLTASWTSPPSSTASLLSIASRRGLVAAAGPDGVVLAETESVRKAFESPKDGDSDVRTFEPQLRIPMPMRISHLTFTADENYLLLSAETGGGLAAYDVASLLQGATQSIFELSTNGETLRGLAPNPTSEKAELCALVTSNGHLHMANMKERALSPPLRSNVSCLSWSTKGKQLVAGLGDGSIAQLTPEGEEKGSVPPPPNAPGHHVSSLAWLENNLFLAVHTSTSQTPPTSVYNVVTRQAPTAFTYQKLLDPVDPFGSEKIPHHSFLRLKDYAPHLKDLLVVSSTASPDVGLLTRAAEPLTKDALAAAITNVFTTTELSDDTKRATLPMTETMDDSVPVGVALDLSSKETVYKPIPTDEMNESPGPLPAFWLLTHEGILCSWWIVYNDAVRQGVTYQGMAAAAGTAPAATSSAFATPSPAPALAAPTASSAFGAPSSGSAFGAPSALGQKSSVWGSPSGGQPASSAPVFGSSTFGSAPASSAPAFGKPSLPAFGQSSALGMKSSPWATGNTASSTPAFAQPAFGSAPPKSTFGSNVTPSQPPTGGGGGGGFANFASQGGFGSLGGGSASTSIFATKGTTPSALATPADQSMDTDTAFPPQKEAAPTPSGQFSSTPFKLQSSFKPDPKAADDSGPAAPSGGLFGSGFGAALSDASKTTPSPAKDEALAAAAPVETPKPKTTTLFGSQPFLSSTTPSTTPAPFKFDSKPAPSAGGGIFGARSALFGTQAKATATPEKPEPAEPPAIKVEPEETPMSNIPLPPESTSRTAYPLGESGSSSTASLVPDSSRRTPTRTEEPPLPPDFATPRASARADQGAPGPQDTPKSATAGDGAASAPGLPDDGSSDVASDDESQSSAAGGDDAPLPPDFAPMAAPAAPVPPPPEERSFSEGSGTDLGKDLSPSTTGITQTPGLTPQSSFGGVGSSTFSLPRPDDRPRALFGEVNRHAPIFPRPTMESPRSPSPVRGAVPSRMLGADTPRSVSAPGMASQILGVSNRHDAKPHGQPAGKGSNLPDPFVRKNQSLQKRREEEETRPLVDEEDDRMQEFLERAATPTLELDEFVARSDVKPPATESIPSQVEAVYRDINSMIDTLGLNARSLTGFVKGHRMKSKSEDRKAEDLDIPDDWVLCEVNALGEIMDDDLDIALEDGRVQDLEEKLESVDEILREVSRLRAKKADLQRIIQEKFDPEQVENNRFLPLSPEQTVQQNALRKQYAAFAKALCDAEEAVTLLKARLASTRGSSTRNGTAPPTVEAVIRTINRMTSMAEKRSGDVDVLENQMRKMRIGSAAPSSREGSPMMTTPRKRATGGSAFSPEASRSLLRMSTLSPMRDTPPRKKISGFTTSEKTELMGKKSRRQHVLDKLEASVMKNGVSVWSMEDID